MGMGISRAGKGLRSPLVCPRSLPQIDISARFEEKLA